MKSFLMSIIPAQEIGFELGFLLGSLGLLGILAGAAKIYQLITMLF